MIYRWCETVPFEDCITSHLGFESRTSDPHIPYDQSMLHLHRHTVYARKQCIKQSMQIISMSVNFISHRNLPDNLLLQEILWNPTCAVYVYEAHQWSFSGHKLWCEDFYCSLLCYIIFSLVVTVAHGRHMVQLRFVFYCDCHVNILSGSASSWEVSDKTSQNDETAVGDCSLYGDGLQPAGGPLQHNCRYVILQ